MPNVKDVLAEVCLLTANGFRDVAAAFALDGSFIFIEATNPDLQYEVESVIQRGGQPACVFGWGADGKLRVRAVREFRTSEKQVELLYQHKVFITRRIDGGTD